MPLIRRYHFYIQKCSPEFRPNGTEGDPPEIEQFLEATPGDLEITAVTAPGFGFKGLQTQLKRR